VQFKKGHKKLGGRKKGSINLNTKVVNDLTYGPQGPFHYLILKMNDEDTEESVKMDCAKALLQYTNRKKPVESEISHSGSISIADQIKTQFND